MTTEQRESYADTVKRLRAIPDTWIPALIRELALIAMRKKLFIKGGLERFARNIEESYWR